MNSISLHKNEMPEYNFTDLSATFLSNRILASNLSDEEKSLMLRYLSEALSQAEERGMQGRE